ncbi:hypothetical protein EYR40_004437 [Pleurotus pulmonarius]|nr:hypothetical protein EYR40_004437 [Pleurotus pulmonarius]KAF4607138.1 hypothetical protein EYR38_001197 [Pleurotus pulmonarius]
MSKKNDDRANIVVVGGGGAGSIAAHALSSALDAAKYSLILINPLPYRICLPATARVAVSNVDNLQQEAFILFDKLFYNNNGTFLQGKVASIAPSESGDGGHVLLETGENISYKILVLAPGAIWDEPLSFPDDESRMDKFLADTRLKIHDAEDIVIVGGGAVGIGAMITLLLRKHSPTSVVELCGEIKDIYPDKGVTIVHGRRLLMNDTYPDNFRIALETCVRARGVNVILNDYVDEANPLEASTIITRGGKTIRADCILKANGPRPNTDLITASLGGVATSGGLLKVESTLQLVGHAHIFVGGDVVDIKEEKQVAKAQAHAAVITANISAFLSQKPLQPYKGSTEMIVVTIGKGGGVGYFDFLWGIVLGDWFAWIVKSKSVAVPMVRGYMGY